ncbi:hypothetical protein GOSPT_052_00060 [Gordonia sputi NBRC 100414]|uniref:Uncharacterized protein n=1 Tax=Gordonia sputi NBRC 100414 TaxID=1089453 RepID=H5TZE4_9ACTN|nr:hypothetical protein GOSPT_052_00060 [Gordonia sputi NBRC 100414]
MRSDRTGDDGVGDQPIERGLHAFGEQPRRQEVRTERDALRSGSAESSNRVAQHDVAGAQLRREHHVDRTVQACRQLDGAASNHMRGGGIRRTDRSHDDAVAGLRARLVESIRECIGQSVRPDDLCGRHACPTMLGHQGREVDFTVVAGREK